LHHFDVAHHVGWCTISAPPLLWRLPIPLVLGPGGGGPTTPPPLLAHPRPLRVGPRGGWPAHASLLSCLPRPLVAGGRAANSAGAASALPARVPTGGAAKCAGPGSEPGNRAHSRGGKG